MPPTIITKESLYKRITELERKHCCNKNQFFDTFADFPAEGAAGVLYIDKETGIIYIWDSLNSVYKVAEYIIEVTYSELSTLITNGELIPGQKYLLSDYQTVHTIPTTADLNTGPIEPLIVTALSLNELEPIAFSTLYPNDVIYYHRENGNASFPGSTKGYISKRIDTLYNNTVGNDFRNCKYRRYKLNVTTEWDGVTAYTELAVVKKTATNEIYIAVKANTNVALSDAGVWNRYPFDNNTYNGHPTSGLVNVPYDSLDYQDQYLFRDTYSVVNYYDNVFIATGLYDSVISFLCFGNIVGSNFNGNTIDDRFQSNSVKSFFSNNTLGTGFRQNIVGHNFSENTMGTYCFSNYFGPIFNNNLTGNDFESNHVLSKVMYNRFGKGAKRSSFGFMFQYNKMGQQCLANTFHNFCTNNTMLDNFTNTVAYANTVGIDFTPGTHVYGTYSKTIFKVPDGTFRLSYIDNAGVNQIVDPTT